MKHTLIPLVLLPALLAATPGLRAQTEAVSVEEMAAGFRTQYVENAAFADTSRYDILYFGRRHSSRFTLYGADSDYTRGYCDQPALRRAGDIALPPSEYLWVTESTDSTDTPEAPRHQGKLYWLRPRNARPTAENEALHRRLAQAFGSETLGDSLKAVPARWFTGELEGIGTPCYIYGNRLVSTRSFRGKVQKGQTEARGKCFGTEYMPQGSLAAEAEYVRLGSLAVPPPEQGRWSQVPAARLEAKAVVLLFVKLNDELRRTGKAQVWEERDEGAGWFDLLLYMDEGRKAHLHVLTPDTLDERQQQTIDELRAALAAQPAGLLRECRAIDGRRFPGYYLRAAHGRNGLWAVEDRRNPSDCCY
ncbi:MAG: DUF5030 domain-containing protein [Bacteroidaceae bacterium]|jgi:hypothetical protein